MRKFIFLPFILLQLLLTLKAQVSTKKNFSGYWNDSLSWVNNYSPGENVLKQNVYCFGEVTSLTCLDFNQSHLTITDTLIINGNLTIKNTSSLTIEESGCLFVFGDYTSMNKVDVRNKGVMVVAGKFAMQGADSKGSFINGGNLYIFDDNPVIKFGKNYESIIHQDQAGDTIYGFHDYQSYMESMHFEYYHSLPFSNREISTQGNPCTKFEIIRKGKLCMNSHLTFFLDAVGTDYSETISWNFGVNAIPMEAYGFGPHKVLYEGAGEKKIEVIQNGKKDFKNNQSFIVQDIPLSVSIINDKNEILSGLYLDEVYEGASSEFRTNGSVESVYRWMVDDMGIDTITDYFYTVHWAVEPGEYELSVIEISSSGCESSKVTEVVLVQDFEEEDIFKKKNYAFTPNDDNINDTWEIQGIENYPLAKIYIFNRKSKLLYKSESNYQNDWNGVSNGSKLPIGSYYYVIDLSAYDRPEKRGVLTLIH